jgi:hypothetical protein
MLCVVGYFLPWVTYHPENEGYIRNLPWSGWTTAWSALGEVPRSLLAANVINAVVPAAFLCTCLLPLVAGMLALLVGTRAWLDNSWQIPGRLYWSAVAVGTFALLLMTYSLDPWGWSTDTEWVIFREPAPTVELGLYSMYAGTLAILAGGLLSRDKRKRTDPIVAQHA